MHSMAIPLFATVLQCDGIPDQVLEEKDIDSRVSLYHGLSLGYLHILKQKFSPSSHLWITKKNEYHALTMRT